MFVLKCGQYFIRAMKTLFGTNAKGLHATCFNRLNTCISIFYSQAY